MIVSLNDKTERLCNVLDYTNSSAFIQFDSANIPARVDKSFVHLFERAVESCDLKGVYSCQPPSDQPDSTPKTDSVPIVYVCEAETEDKAQKSIGRFGIRTSFPSYLLSRQIRFVFTTVLGSTKRIPSLSETFP